MPKTATPRKPETVSRKLAETRNTSKNRSLSSLLGIGDNEKRLATDIASGLNDVVGRGTIAALLGLPADLGGLLYDSGAAVNNKIKEWEVALGLVKPEQARWVQPNSGVPYLGSEHIGQKMERAGLVSDVRRPKTELLASLISPTQAFTAGYKAPQMARAGVQMMDNLASAPTMARMGQRGAIILNPSPFKVAHGSADEFDAFKSGMGVTAKHIYTTPEEFADDAFKYGNHRYVAEASPSSVIDFGDYDKLDGKTLSAMEKAAVDAGLVDEYTSFDDVLERVMSGNLYNGSGGPRDQNAFLGELLSEYGAVRMPDAGFDGAVSQSYVFDDPSALRILERNGQPTGNLGKMVAPQDEALRVAEEAPSIFREGGDKLIDDRVDYVARERFNIPALNKISGGGSDRDVYDLGNGSVLKVAKSARGLAQNDAWDYYLAQNGLLPNVTEIGSNYIVADKVLPPDKATKELVKGLNSFGYTDWRNGSEGLHEYLYDNGLSDVLNYDLMHNDFKAIRNWGTTPDGNPIHLDEGTFNSNLLDEYRGTKNMDNADFRAVHAKSKAAKKKYGDKDKATMYGVGLLSPLLYQNQEP